MEQPITRSKAYQQMYDDEFMMETFGTLQPDIKTRTAYFFELWMQWRPYRVLLRGSSGTKTLAQNRARALIKSLGYREFHDFQIRQGEIRFSDKNILAMCMLGGLKEHVERGDNV